MKQRYLFIWVLILINAFHTNAQGIYQFWGATAQGGPDNNGTIFKLDGSGNNFRVTHQFKSVNPGIAPGFTEPVEYNGKFYGMTVGGGANDMGVIFEWDPVSNVYNKKIDMMAANGANPYGSLALYAGKFYGMTASGGLFDGGVIFEWDPATNIYTKKTDLDNTNGRTPYGSLTLKGNTFYGMTNRGGINDVGVIFEWNPATNIYSKKIDFLNGPDGKNPYGNLCLYNGLFYGMTSRGGMGAGVIFEWDPASNSYTNQYSFNYTEGGAPRGSLVMHAGKFYGTTYLGGINDQGVIFEWDPVSYEYTMKVEMINYSDGRHPIGNLVYQAGKFYGMASGHIQGQNPNPIGSVLFEWDPVSNEYEKKLSLTTGTGNFPQGTMALKNGMLYGMTQMGGSNNTGVIFQWDPASDTYTKKIDFNGNDGRRPGGLVYNAGKIVGVTQWGGESYSGSVFEMDQESGAHTIKAGLDLENGSNPFGSLIKYNGKYYGMATRGGYGNNGTIFEWDPATNMHTNKVNFNGTDGSRPMGSLTLLNGMFYGMTELGGNSFAGTLFEWDPSTNAVTKKVDFDGTNGGHPYGSLTAYNGKLYGMTGLGGDFGIGVIFEWDPASNVYTKKIDFDGNNGDYPRGNLALLNNKFYGMTEQGGASNGGVLFEWDPLTNNFAKKMDLNAATGNHPFASLTANAGKLYGMMAEGGTTNSGVIFEWEPVSNQYSIKKQLISNEAANPGIGNDLVTVPAPVSKGTAGTCVTFPVVTIDNSNNNTWVPIIDNEGNAIAEIKANGNNLGTVSTSMFINNATVREDVAKRLYLDRNITITPQVPVTPGTAVDIRLYLRASEFLALKNAVNSMGQPSGVNSINDLGIFKNDEGCSAAILAESIPVVTNASNWEADYVLSASIQSFSSFYFFNKATGGPVPVASLEFNGQLLQNDVELNWDTKGETKTLAFELERSLDGRSFTKIATVAAFNQPGNHTYSHIDPQVNSLSVPVIYYRLKKYDLDGRIALSRVVAIHIDYKQMALVYPNPVYDKTNLVFNISKAENVQGRIIDATGRVVKQLQWNVTAGITSYSLNLFNLAKGMYYLELKGDNLKELIKIVKE